MVYATAVPVTRLEFAEGFPFYGASTSLGVAATVNLPVAQITHTATGETLTDGALIPAQDATAFDVPNARTPGWVTDEGGHIRGWSYDLTVTATAPGEPTVTWSGTISPQRDVEVITPGMGQTATAAPDADITLTNAARVEAFTAARGGTIGTGGRAAIAFRYDHGLANFRDKIVPLHTARGIPFGNALNPGNLSHPENGGVTWADINGWVANNGLQLLAHSYDHGPASTVSEITTKVDLEFEAYRANAPEHVVEYFAPPGVSGGEPGNWLGWTTANTVEHFTDQYPAAMAVLRRYAVTSGYLDGVYRPQSGRVRQGLSHMTMDGLTTFAECKSVIDDAVDLGASLQVMIHPSLVDTAGYISTAVITEMLDYVGQLRTSGDLVVLSPSGLVLADGSHSYRHDALRYGDFNDSTKWAGTTGWAFGGNTASTSTGTPLRRGVSLSNVRYARGRHRELTAKFRATSGAVVRLEAFSSTGGVGISKDFTLPASTTWVERSLPVHLPLSATGLTIAIGRVSGGLVEMRDAGILAL